MERGGSLAKWCVGQPVRDVNLTPAPRPSAVVLFWAFLER
jgi:hypothetical protein